jgi:glucose/arabinose dehydrogenase
LKRALTVFSVIAAVAIAGTLAVIFFAQSAGTEIVPPAGPTLRNGELRVELVAQGLQTPTSMRFLDKDNILVLQQHGQVRLVSSGQLVEKSVLQVDVETVAEQGLLGIAIPDGSTDVFVYLTENTEGDILRNRVYKMTYDAQSRTLVNGTLVLDLPGEPGPFHNGGKTAIGPDGYLYTAIGDTNAGGGMLDNDAAGREPDDKSVVFRVDRETGQGAEDNPFYGHEDENMHQYFAYGIRNSFGMDFDPVTGNLWITENGEDEYDEVNLVRPGFNSGWHQLMGPMARSEATEEDLVMFEGSHFRDPAFSWRDSVGVTDIEFLASDRLGEKYENNVFVGDINSGNLYYFELNEQRDGFVLPGALSDAVADSTAEASAVRLGSGFGGITDIETGPDGNLYVLSYIDGKIYRIVRG